MRSLVVIMIVGLGFVSGEMRFIDLTHTFGGNSSAVNWPVLPPYNFSLVNRLVINDSVIMVANQFQAAEHFGTHLDVPYHYCPKGKFMHEIPLKNLSGPGVVLDFKSQAEENYDYSVTLQDIQDWETEHGQIPEGAIVLFNFGWYKHWPDPEKVFSTKDLSNMSTFHFPGLGIEASRYLSGTRKVDAVGVDSPSPQFPDSPVHVNLLCEHGLVILENVDNLDAMPATGSQVYIGAVKLDHGGGAPVRLFATIDDDGKPSKAVDVRLIDLTHTLGGNNSRVNWPSVPTYNFSLVDRTVINNGVVIVLNQFQTAEHFGTHVDAPYHFCPKGKFMHEVPLEKLSGPGVVLDFKSQAEKDYDYRVTPQDVKDWETKHGQIPEGAVVLFNFGWYKHWPDPEKVFSTKDILNMSTFHFPGLGIEASRYLSGTRKVNAVGVDTPSPELRNVSVHINLLCEHGLVILENVDNLDAMPATGSHVYIGAVKLDNGGGAPVRLFASVTIDDGDGNINGAGQISPNSFCISLILIMIMMISREAPGLYV